MCKCGNKKSMYIISAWSKTYSCKDEMEYELGVRFMGNGWYTNGNAHGDHLLIIEVSGNWCVSMYMDPNIRKSFQDIGNLPVWHT